MKRSILISLLSFITLSSLAQNLQKGINSYKDGKLKEAKANLEDYKSKSQEYEKAQYYLGRIAFDEEEYSDAIDYFKEAIKKNNQSADYYAWLGNAYGVYTQNISKIRQGMVAPKIKKNYEKAVALDPQNLDAQWGLIEYYTQAPSIMGGSMTKATETANVIMSFNEKEGYRALSTVYQRDKKYTEAEQAFVKLVELDSVYATSLGTFYQNRQMYDKAFKHFEKMRVSEPKNTNAVYQIGRTSALSGLQLEKGIKALEEYMTLPLNEGSPSYAAAKMRLAMIYEKMGNKTKAKSLYQASLNEDPKMQLAKEGLKRVK
ncbi:tetratricopeptide repeat protein [Roseivirga sp. E12]|uniref:tetratricopeptide repeat protein n=1 Tax=Roseivirga sp. E12 TaxID=2819237 RepID=UPI001ABC29BF|nr:tetratricopeptide repeat protein [Roseivirga sp. E12]MBO3697053.1 tetratricopeptide repeat protein [Roseivirga sp. E12]